MNPEVAAIQAKSECFNMRVIGHHDLNGHGDGMQLVGDRFRFDLLQGYDVGTLRIKSR